MRQCALWLQRLHLVDEHVSEAKEYNTERYHDVKELKAKPYDDEEEIEEAIEAGEDCE